MTCFMSPETKEQKSSDAKVRSTRHCAPERALDSILTLIDRFAASRCDGHPNTADRLDAGAGRLLKRINLSQHVEVAVEAMSVAQRRSELADVWKGVLKSLRLGDVVVMDFWRPTIAPFAWPALCASIA